MRNVEVTDCNGNSEDAVIDVQNGALFLAKNLTVTTSGDTYFNSSGVYDTDRLSESNWQSYFANIQSEKGVVSLDSIDHSSAEI